VVVCGHLGSRPPYRPAPVDQPSHAPSGERDVASKAGPLFVTARSELTRTSPRQAFATSETRPGNESLPSSSVSFPAPEGAPRSSTERSAEAASAAARPSQIFRTPSARETGMPMHFPLRRRLERATVVVWAVHLSCMPSPSPQLPPTPKQRFALWLSPPGRAPGSSSALPRADPCSRQWQGRRQRSRDRAAMPTPGARSL
jgi:hypothetical protein